MQAGPRRGVLKASVLLAFIAAAVLAVRFTLIKGFLTPDQLGRFLESMGFWAPFAFVLIYAAGVCMFVPGTILGAIGALLFGVYGGFLYVWLGAMLGGSAAFFIGRTLGREFAASLIGDKLRRYDDAIERNGFATVLYLRLLYFPFTPLNFGMGLTKVRFWDYLAGTGLGILVGTFIFTFFVGTLKEVWSRGQWGGLLSSQVFSSLGLLVFSFFIPKIVQKFKASRRGTSYERE